MGRIVSRKNRIVVVAFASFLCLSSATGSQVKPKGEKPVFMVSYCQEVTDPYQSLELAVWKSGRVIWRVGEAGPSYGGGWKVGKYFEGSVPPERVRAALEQFRERKLLGVFDWASGMWPTSSPRRIEISDGANQTRVALAKLTGTQAEVLAVQELWDRAKPTLMPKKGRAIPAPDSSKWW